MTHLNLCLLLLWIKYCRVGFVRFHLMSWTSEFILILFLDAAKSCLRCDLRWRSFQEFCWAAPLLLIRWREGLLSLLLLMLLWTLRWWCLHIADLSRVWILVLGCALVCIKLSKIIIWWPCRLVLIALIAMELRLEVRLIRSILLLLLLSNLRWGLSAGLARHVLLLLRVIHRHCVERLLWITSWLSLIVHNFRLTVPSLL